MTTNDSEKPTLVPVARYFDLPPQQKAMLKGLADPKCYKCRGTGVTRWAKSGAFAVVCSCAEKRMAWIDAELSRQRVRLEAELRSAREKMERDDSLELLTSFAFVCLFMVAPPFIVLGWFLPQWLVP